MSKTIDDFTNFIHPNKAKEHFSTVGDFYSEEDNDEFRSFKFYCSDETDMNATEEGLDNELVEYGFSNYYFETYYFIIL